MDSQNIKESNMLSLNDDLPNELNEELSPLKSTKSSRLIKGTIISQEHEHRVKQEDYPFYASPNDEEFERILEQFQPDLDDRFLFYNTDEQLRLIFGSDEKYSDREEIQYQTFIKYCVCVENKAYKHYDKSYLMRILDACQLDIEAAVEELNFDHKWRVKTLPIFLSDSMKNLLQSGLYYAHGRDRSLRPITIFSPAVALNHKFGIKEAILASHFVDQYVIDFLLAPGKIENWIGILDLGNLSFSSLPKQWIIEFIKAFSHHYYARLRKTYMLNASFGVRCMWNIVKIFVDNVSKSKLVVEGSNTHQSLLDGVHPKQLQNKFGGEAENISVFWPPYSPSNEYGVDPCKLNIDSMSSDTEGYSDNQIIANSQDIFTDDNIKATQSSTLLVPKLKAKNKKNPLKYCLNKNNVSFCFPNQANIRPSNQEIKEEPSSACCCTIF